MAMGDALLLVMPDGHRRASCAAAFREAGFRVLQAPTVGIALARCEREHPDVIVTDVLLPGIPGVDIARLLRSCMPAGRMPLIVGLLSSCFDDTEGAAESILFDHLVTASSPELVVREVCDAQQRAHGNGFWRPASPLGPLVLH